MDDLSAGGIPMVELGDASIAEPFTSKMPTIQSCVDIDRQGRCTLVSSMQMVRTTVMKLSGMNEHTSTRYSTVPVLGQVP
jgi:manganese-transporting P-type ATPase